MRRIPFLMLACALTACQLNAPTHNAIITPNQQIDPANGTTPQLLGSAAPTQTSAASQTISGHVYLDAASLTPSSYRLLDLTTSPGVDALIELRSLAQLGVSFSETAKSDASGQYSLGNNVFDKPMFLRAIVPSGAGNVTLLAPVPSTHAAQISVDIDVASTMLVDYLLDQGPVPSNTKALQPDTLLALQNQIRGALTNQTAPDLHDPTAVDQQIQSLRQGALQAAFAPIASAQPTPTPPPPVPSPVTITPPSSAPGPTRSDPPLYTGAPGSSENTGTPEPASYLSAAVTQLQTPGHVASLRFHDLNQVFIAAIDHKDNTLFALFRDTGPTARLTPASLGITTALDLALDAEEHLYVLDKGKLTVSTLALGPTISKNAVVSQDASLQQASALAVDPAGTYAYVGGQDGAIHRFSLPSGTLDAAYTPKLVGALVAMTVGADGKLYALNATGAIAQLGTDGTVLNAAYASVPNGVSLAIDATGTLYVGMSNNQVDAVTSGQAATSYMQTPSAVTGTAVLGGYLFVLDAGGSLDCDNIVQQEGP